MHTVVAKILTGDFYRLPDWGKGGGGQPPNRYEILTAHKKCQYDPFEIGFSANEAFNSRFKNVVLF